MKAARTASNGTNIDRQIYLATRAYAREIGVEILPLNLICYKNFITCAKEINCFRILFAC